MTPEPLLHIVPRLPPAIDGVGDYAITLAQKLREHGGCESRFLVVDPQWNDGPAPAGFAMQMQKLSAPTPNALSEALLHAGAKLVLLHYVGYGYQARGVPLWLWRGLRQWKSAPDAHVKPPARLLVFFHELWSSGMPWRSTFYWHLPQRWLAGALHRLADVSLTSTARMRWLLIHAQVKKCLLLPVPATVPIAAREAVSRRRTAPFRVSIFGQPAARWRTVSAHDGLLRHMNAHTMIDRLLVVGKDARPDGPDMFALSRILRPGLIETASDVPAPRVAELLRETDFHLSGYPAELACKSTAFMAALGNGCPVVLSDDRMPFPLVAGDHFLVCTRTRRSIEGFFRQIAEGALERVAAQGRRWYLAHCDWPVTARKFSAILAETGEPAVSPTSVLQ